MKLYGYWRSSSTWRVRIALAIKQIAYESVPVHLLKEGGQHKAELYRAQVNPLAQVPVLEIEQAGDVHRLSQSLAIIEYLEERHPAPPLLAGDAVRRARIRQIAEMINSGTQPLQNLSVLAAVKQLGGDERAWAQRFIGEGLAAVESVARGTAGAYSVGDEVSLADLCLVPQLYNARRFGLVAEAYPTLLGIEARCAELDAFVAAHPDRQPDAQP